jgi:hypothetical protein
LFNFKEFIARHFSSFELGLFSLFVFFGFLLTSKISLQLEWLNLDYPVASRVSFAVTHVLKYFLVERSGFELLLFTLSLDVFTVGPLAEIAVRI